MKFVSRAVEHRDLVPDSQPKHTHRVVRLAASQKQTGLLALLGRQIKPVHWTPVERARENSLTHRLLLDRIADESVCAPI
jgi:hypothetical protein